MYLRCSLLEITFENNFTELSDSETHLNRIKTMRKMTNFHKFLFL
jgi:hypothetical protein